jgi:hypothetical protein
MARRPLLLLSRAAATPMDAQIFSSALFIFLPAAVPAQLHFPMAVSPPFGRHPPMCSSLHVRRQPICAASNNLGELLAVLHFFCVRLNGRTSKSCNKLCRARSRCPFASSVPTRIYAVPTRCCQTPVKPHRPCCNLCFFSALHEMTKTMHYHILAAPCRRHASRIARRQRAQTNGMHARHESARLFALNDCDLFYLRFSRWREYVRENIIV